jgi:hypothetical protein
MGGMDVCSNFLYCDFYVSLENVRMNVFYFFFYYHLYCRKNVNYDDVLENRIYLYLYYDYVLTCMAIVDGDYHCKNGNDLYIHNYYNGHYKTLGDSQSLSYGLLVMMVVLYYHYLEFESFPF